MSDLIDVLPADIPGGATERKNWKDVALSAIAGQEQMLADHLTGGAALESFRLKPIKSSARSDTFELDYGKGRAVLKVFDPSLAHSNIAYQRERSALMALRDLELAPPLLAFSDRRQFVLSSFVPHLDESAAEELVGRPGLVRAIGAWLARMDRLAPSQEALGNWLGYLRKFGRQLDIDALGEGAEFLAQVPVCGLSLAQCDASLRNFLLRPDGLVIGCDFENAQLRPRGWDFVMLYLSLVQVYPRMSTSLLDDLADGFSSCHKGALITDELCSLARMMLCMRAAASSFEPEVHYG